jgi:GntR family transcriptional regulator / MocR family aminotransferase
MALERARGDLQGQLYRALRTRILSGALPPGTRLPSTRQLAVSLGLSRATVVSAYERLQAEEYVTSTTGKASRVADIMPPVAAPSRLPQAVPTPLPAPGALPAPLAPGVPDLTAFPAAQWRRSQASAARRLAGAALGYSAPFGLPALAEAILAHIAVTRGVAAEPEQLVLFPSTRAAIALLSRIILRRAGAPVWIEDPAYPSAQQILCEAGAQLVPVPVDAAGITVHQLAGLPPARLIYVTPSHQYPTGVTMSLTRRLSLLELARQAGAFILEDDYDSEFQFDGRPIAALQGIDQTGSVIYLGTLSKVLAPGLRLAYAVVPHSLLADVQRAVRLEGLAVSIHTQAAFLAFLREGYFGAHIKRMTPIYAARMAHFREEVQRACGALAELGPGTGGLQLALWFKHQNISDVAIAASLQRHGYAPQPISPMYLGPPRAGLLCGIAGLMPESAQAVATDIATTLAA